MLLIALVSLVRCKLGAEKALGLAQEVLAADTKDTDSSKSRCIRFVPN